MNKDITYAEALAKHPTEVAEVIRLMRKGRSKAKNTDPATWSWSYSWGEMLPAGSFGSFADMLAQDEPWSVKEARKSIEQRVEDRLSRCRVGLCGHSQQVSVSSEALREHVTEELEKQVGEEQRVANLTPEQKDQEAQEALAWLTGPKNSGFMAIRLTPK